MEYFSNYSRYSITLKKKIVFKIYITQTKSITFWPRDLKIKHLIHDFDKLKQLEAK